MRWKEMAGVAVLALVACAEEAPEPEPVVRPVKTLTVGGTVGVTREYPGRLRAAQQADMAFEVPGRIVAFVRKEGERASKGDLLARLDARDYENQLEQARAAHKNRRTFLGRMAEAHAEGAVSDQDLDDAEAQVEVAAAELKIQQKALDDTNLLAPFDGVMSRKLVQDFANVQAKQPVLIFEDPSHMEIKVAIPERDLASRRGMEVDSQDVDERMQPEVVVTALPDHSFPASLKELATTADPTTRTFEATLTFKPGPGILVLPGMTAKVISRPMREQGAPAEVFIPARAAVSGEAGEAAVWIVEEGGTVSTRPVTLGPLRGDQVLVTGGLAAGDVIAISGMSQLREGLKVRPWEREAAQ